MKDYRLQLDPGSKKFFCPDPDCGKKRFVRFIDRQTGNYLPIKYGKCDRESNCGYFLSPYHDGYAKALAENQSRTLSHETTPGSKNLKKNPQALNATIPLDLFHNSIKPPNVENKRRGSSLFKGLLDHPSGIPEEAIIEAFDKFQIGFSNYIFSHQTSVSYGTPNVFWLLDKQLQPVGGQVVLFDSKSPTLSTVKNPIRHTRPVYHAIKESYRNKGRPIPSWLKAYEQNSNKFPCPFGLQQVFKAGKDKQIAICEAYKTAVICSIFYPEYIWMAIGSLNYLNAQRLYPLAGRKIILFPDLAPEGKAFKDWKTKSLQIEEIIGGNIEVSPILENLDDITTQEVSDGIDLADYLLTRFDWSAFQESRERSINQSTEIPSTNIKRSDFVQNGKMKISLPEGWYYDRWFNNVTKQWVTTLINPDGYPAIWDRE